MSGRPAPAAQCGRIVLGTAQFGARYGIANRTGCPGDEALAEILEAAQAGGISCLDTARAYGNAEERLGAALAADRARWTIITKVAPLAEMMAAEGVADPGAAVAASVARSMAALKGGRLDVVMFHRAADLTLPGALEALAAERERGRIAAIGVSVSTPEEAIGCLDFEDVQHLQIPFNFLDRRWEEAGFPERRSARPDVVVYARSAFLQGLLLAPATVWPEWVANRCEVVDAIDAAAAQVPGGRLAVCLGHVAATPWIDAAVIGVDTAGQLREMARVESDAALPPAVAADLRRIAAMAPPRLLNPALW